jgi:hypothetical protein
MLKITRYRELEPRLPFNIPTHDVMNAGIPNHAGWSHAKYGYQRWDQGLRSPAQRRLSQIRMTFPDDYPG